MSEVQDSAKLLVPSYSALPPRKASFYSWWDYHSVTLGSGGS
jgi:hypothetical protein